jgi:hypothetical protein
MYTDNEILSGMLTAIQDFIKDGFSGSADGGGDDWSLDHLKFGDRNIFIERGDYMYIAAVFKGDIGWKLKRELNDCLQEIDTEYSKILKEWTGALDGLGGINKILSNKFKALAPKEKRKIYKRDSPDEDAYEEERVIYEELGPEIPELSKPRSSGSTKSKLESKKTASAPMAEPVTPKKIGVGDAPLALAEAAPARPITPIISYIFGSQPKIPRPLSNQEREKLPLTKPISDENREADWRRIDV